ncbi:hypothetical protein ACWEQ3_43225 [Streptomyces mirabilis]
MTMERHVLEKLLAGDDEASVAALAAFSLTVAILAPVLRRRG